MKENDLTYVYEATAREELSIDYEGSNYLVIYIFNVCCVRVSFSPFSKGTYIVSYPFDRRNISYPTTYSANANK